MEVFDGVRIDKLETHADQRGFFREIVRFTESYTDVAVGQLSHSSVNQGTIKGWHGHVYQSQWNYIVKGEALVMLRDNRKESLTYGEEIKFTAGEFEAPCSYFFPPGILHGYQCLRGPMQIIYVTSGVYDLEDEIRMDMQLMDASQFD